MFKNNILMKNLVLIDGQSNKFTNFLADFVDWPGLCSLALERLKSYAKIKVYCIGDKKEAILPSPLIRA